MHVRYVHERSNMRNSRIFKLLILCFVSVLTILALSSCSKGYNRSFYLEPSATEIKFGETITFTNKNKDVSMSYWAPKCSEGFEIQNLTSKTFSITPTKEGKLYLRFNTYSSRGETGPVSQLIVINVKREEETITTAEQLLSAKDASVRYVLGGDIDMSSVKSHVPFEFTGALDGKGYSIKNFTFAPTTPAKDQNVGLWSKNTGTIENVVFENSNVRILFETASASVAVGLNEGTIKNVVVKGTLLAEQSNNVGAVCGINNGTVSECSSEAIVEGKQYTGGIAGVSNSAISNSSNKGTVEGTNDVGGIVGKVTEAATITGNKNTGAVEGYLNVGGIIGSTADGKIVQINSSANEGEVKGNSYVGGIIGTGNAAVLFGCNNSGVINAESAYVGGIGGKIYSARRSENMGAVNSEAKDIADKDGSFFKIYIAGIAGYAQEVSECANRQRITVNAGNCQYIGGVAGFLDGKGTDDKLNNNFNEGKITAASTSRYVGGIIGYMKNAALRGTVNEGDVLGGSLTAGIVGYSESGGLYFSTNKGIISAKTTSDATQICFYKDTASTTIFNNASDGSVSSREGN